jgi:hypothetical protein
VEAFAEAARAITEATRWEITDESCARLKAVLRATGAPTPPIS